MLKSVSVRTLASPFTPLLDLIVAVTAAPGAWLLCQARRFGLHLLPKTKKMLCAVGVFPVRDHYYEPAFHPRHFRSDTSQPRKLPGIDLREASQLEFVRGLRYADEVKAWKTTQHSALEFSLGNTAFGPGDAEMLYQYVRYLKPRRIVEIGSGNSTKICSEATRKNEQEGSPKVEHVCIEPYEMPWLESLGPEIIRSKVESCPMEIFEKLTAGDFLFIDSSHMIRPQGDVLHEYVEILPRLQSGVHIHIHDIFTPRDYPPRWLVDEVRFWNEQYLLEAMLTKSPRYRIVAAINWLKHDHFELLQTVCPFLEPRHQPGSIYLEVV